MLATACVFASISAFLAVMVATLYSVSFGLKLGVFWSNAISKSMLLVRWS